MNDTFNANTKLNSLIPVRRMALCIRLPTHLSSLNRVRAEIRNQQIRAGVIPLFKSLPGTGTIKSRDIIVDPNADRRTRDSGSNELVFGHGLYDTIDERESGSIQIVRQLGFTTVLERAQTIGAVNAGTLPSDKMPRIPFAPGAVPVK